jgi:hypothetical protein
MLSNKVKFHSVDYWVAACTSFQVCIQIYHVKVWETLVCSICRSWCGFLQKLELFWNIQSLQFFISSNCGFQFYCEPVFCIECVMDYSLLHGMMLGLWWHSCLSFSRPLYVLCFTVLVESLLTRTFFVYSVVLCSVFSLHLLILVLFAYMHCRNERKLTYCVRCS